MNFSALRDYVGEIIVILLLSVVIVWMLSVLKVILSWYISTTWVPQDKNKHPKISLIVGGSKGLGLALAHELLERGSSIILIGRGKEALDAAVDELKSCAQNQKVIGFLGDAADDEWMFKTFMQLYDDNFMPDWIIANAGSSRPGFVADSFPDLKKQINANYFTSTSIITALMKLAKVKSKKGSKIMGSLSKEDLKAVLPKRLVFVGSFLSLTSFIGYSAYSGSKYALKGFSDALRSEFSFLGVKVHFYCPANMDTPGFALENQIKPKITAQIEGQASTSSPKDAALALIGGIFRDRYVISNDLIGELVRVCANVSGPRPNPLSEAFASPVISLALGVFSFMVDRDVKKHFA